MEQGFDAYHKWLGIPPECQPPHHYRLLGLQVFESDPDVIQAAADQRMMHLRGYQTGKHSELSQRLLNEVAAARVCLLNAAKKAAYDEELRKAIEGESPPVAPPSPPPGFDSELLPKPPVVRRSFRAKRSRRFPLAAVVGGLLALVTLLLFVLLYQLVMQRPDSVATESERAESVAPPTVQPGATTAKSPDAGKARETGKKSPKTAPDDRRPPVKKTERGKKDDGDTKKTDRSPFWEKPGRVTDQRATEQDNAPHDATAPLTKLPPEKVVDRAPAKTPDKEPADEQPPPEVDRRAVEPTAEAKDEALQRVKETYKNELAKAKLPDERHALAKKLLSQAEAATAVDANTFALFRLACELSIEAMNVTTAFATVDAAAERYQIEVAPLKTALLATFVRKSRLPQPQRVALAEQASLLLGDAQQGEASERTAELAKLAKSAGRLAHDTKLVAQADACLKECQQAAALGSRFKAAEATLATTPDDPGANLTAGIYYCSVKNDWDRGLAYLAKGDDADLKRLAERELRSPPNSPDEQALLADAWWDASQNADGAKKSAMIRRCVSWCKKAKDSDLDGAARDRVERRLDEIAKLSQEATIAAGRPLLRINRWIPLQSSPTELVGWKTGKSRFAYTNGVIQLREGSMFHSMVAQDATIQAKIKRTAASDVLLMIRNCEKGCYVARLTGNDVSILKRKPGDLDGRTDDDVLARIALPRRARVLDFEFGFSAVGDQLAVLVNGQPVLKAKDSSFAKGTVGLGTPHANDLYATNVVVMVHNKASLIEAQKSLGAGKPSPAKLP